MNAADLARLELAKRAYQAAQPRDAEVQTGVRRARLWLGRPKTRRGWFSKGLVLVVLAIGSLAYAKPQATKELVDEALGRTGAAGGKRLKPGVAAVAPVAAAMHVSAAAVAKRIERTTEPSHAAAERTPQAVAVIANVTSSVKQAAAARAATAARPTALATGQLTSAPQTRPSGPVTDWGRVGQALARGDSTEALAALGELSESRDPSTRDKADLGRAQLLMAHDEPERACALARSLTHRRAGGRIERQAQLLLKSCVP